MEIHELMYEECLAWKLIYNKYLITDNISTTSKWQFYLMQSTSLPCTFTFSVKYRYCVTHLQVCYEH